MFYYDRDGHPLTVEEYSQLLTNQKSLDEYEKYRRVSATSVKSTQGARRELWVSTVWLGIDHSYRPLVVDGKHIPIIFETMVFEGVGGEDGPLDEYSDRYATEAAAIEGHHRAVRWCMKRIQGPVIIQHDAGVNIIDRYFSSEDEHDQH